MTRIEEINAVFTKDFDAARCENTLMVLHANIAMMMRTFVDTMIETKKNTTEDRTSIGSHYDDLKRHHAHNSLASLANLSAGFVKIGAIVYGIDAQTADFGMRLEEAFNTAFKEYNKGKIDAVDSYKIQTSKQLSDEHKDHEKTLDHLKERMQDLGNSTLNKASEAYLFRA
jgi:hypothetical protein